MAWVRWDVWIEQAERPNDISSDVTEQRIADAVSRRERVQDRRGVRSDRYDVDPGRSGVVDREVQLDQLIAAVRSPIGRPGEDQQQAAITHELVARSDES